LNADHLMVGAETDVFAPFSLLLGWTAMSRSVNDFFLDCGHEQLFSERG
jgi:hypothetical protein